jgi:hypothetical protein
MPRSGQGKSRVLDEVIADEPFPRISCRPGVVARLRGLGFVFAERI